MSYLERAHNLAAFAYGVSFSITYNVGFQPLGFLVLKPPDSIKR
jgi:hypothetical protein